MTVYGGPLGAYLIAIAAIVSVIGWGLALAFGGRDAIDRLVGRVVCVTNVGLFIGSFFAKEEELKYPGKTVLMQSLAWIGFLLAIWAVGRLISNETEGKEVAMVGAILRVTSGLLYAVGVISSFF